MSLVARLKLSAHMIFSCASPGIRICSLPRITVLQHCNFYSAHTGQRSQHSPDLTVQKSSQSSSSFPQRTVKAVPAVWPRPKEVPHGTKSSNCVKLIGHVAIPVRFEADSEGKHCAITLISVGNGGGRKSLSIPLAFEGELAHVVSCHVKKNDCIYVSGQLSFDPMGMILSESVGKFYVVVENLNFVNEFGSNFVNEKLGFSFSIGEIGNPSKQETKDIANSDHSSTDQQLTNVSIQVNHRIKKGKRVRKKELEQISNLWRDLIRNPLQWWDYRAHKANGLVKENFPDFKHKERGEPLWVKSAPEFALLGLGVLQCDIKDLKIPRGKGSEKKGGNDDSWQNLAENPDKWWDNRMSKRNPKAPDFKHKETGQALWLDGSPVCAWALSLKDGKNASAMTS